MDTLVLEEFKVKLSSLFGIQTQQIGDIYMQGPSQIHILLTDEVIFQISSFTEGSRVQSVYHLALHEQFCI